LDYGFITPKKGIGAMRLNRRLRIACGLTIVVLLLMVVSCVLLVTTTPIRFLLTPWTKVPTLSSLQTQTPFLLLTVVGPLGIRTRSDLEQFLKVSLPPDTTDLEFVDYNIALQEAAVNVRFKTKRASLDAFLGHLGFTLPLQENLYPFQENDQFIIKYFTWWKPQTAIVYAGGTYAKDPQDIWSVLVDKTNSEQIYSLYNDAFALNVFNR
jgi:hypothetical protein